MKKYLVLLAIAAFMVSLPFGMAMAQQTGQPGTSSQPGVSGQGGPTTPPGMGSAPAVQQPSSWGMDAFKASKVIGAHVDDASGNKIGSIHDLVIDTDSGRVPFAVLDHDGKLSAVPINLFKMGSKDETLILNMDKNQVAQIPTFAKGTWPNPRDRTYSSSIYRYFGMRPYWEESPTTR
jgi:sporulation protein YlmC with PRC-barrel domain